MVTIEEARALLEQEQKPRASTEVPLQKALGRVLATELSAPLDLPPFDRSAMDGYALRYEDLGTGKALKVVGRSDAGPVPHLELGDGEACRIHTGAMIPSGADTVVRQEDVERDGEKLYTPSSLEVQKGNNIRRRGEELEKGESALSAGSRLTPAGIAFLASMGIPRIEVHQNPRIAFLYTGDELVAPGDDLPDGCIYESNSHGIAALLEKNGLSLEYMAHIPDDPEQSREQVGEALDKTEILLLSGGISVGDKDHVKEALFANGIEEIFHKVAQKPGKPIFFGKGSESYVFALPGNPAAGLVGLYEYVLPFIRRCEGDRNPYPRRLKLPLIGNWEKSSDRHVFLKGRIETNGVRILEGQSSAMLQSFAHANALVSIPPGRAPIQEGEAVDVDLLE